MDIQNDGATMAIINTAAVLAAAAEEIPKIIRDGIEKELSGRPDFIATGTPESLPGQIGQAAARSACRQYAAGQSGLTGQAAVNAETACRPYLDSLNPGGEAGIVSPFQGGQCYGGGYDFTFTANNLQGERVSSQQGVSGRLIGAATRTDSNGNPVGGVLRQLSPESQIDFLGLQVNNPGQSPDPAISNVTPQAGTPNDCGDPPPEVIPPRIDPDPTPPPFRFNPNPFIDLPIDIDFNPDGTIAVDFGIGPVTVDAFNGSGGGGGPGDGGGGGEAPPGDVGSPGGGQATGDGGDAEGEAPPGQVLTGLRAVITAFPESRSLGENGVYRAAYYAYMGVPGLLDLDPAGAAVTLDQFVFAEKDNLTAWRLRANRGYNVTVTPYYRTPT